MQTMTQAHPTQMSSLQANTGPSYNSSPSPNDEDPSSSITPDASSSAGGVDMTSLRARALLSMKSKRRKAADGTQPSAHRSLVSLALARPVEDTVMLDYGSEEQSTIITNGTINPDKDSEKSMEVQREGLGREDGEVSDEDTRKVALEKDDVVVDMEVEDDHEELHAADGVASSSLPLTAASKTQVSAQQIVSEALEPLVRKESVPPQVPTWVPDPDHVRPGLTSKHHEPLSDDFSLPCTFSDY